MVHKYSNGGATREVDNFHVHPTAPEELFLSESGAGSHITWRRKNGAGIMTTYSCRTTAMYAI